MSSFILNGRYKLVKAAGQGGTANVFLAEETKSGAKVAVKVLKKSMAEQQDMLGRFRREAATLEKVAHPNIVKLIELSESPQGLVLVMEWAEGQRLDEISLTPDEVKLVLVQLASALATVHAAGVLHRDLKPENVMVERRPEEPVRARLLDFGIARFGGEPPPGGFVSMLGQVAGTPSILAPEQIRGEAPDTRSDVYSFGILGWRMVTGAVPFAGKSDFATLQMHLQDKLPKFKPLDPSLAVFEPVLRKCLEKKPEDRFHEGMELLSALGTATTAPAASAPPAEMAAPASTPSPAAVEAPVKKKKWWPFG
ncbi:MAG: serine/threonine-protein kinase [Archangium sp.]